MKVYFLVAVLLVGAVPSLSALQDAPDVPPLQVTVTGRVTVDEGGPYPRPTISFTRSGQEIRTTLDRGGIFEVRLTRGEYAIAVSPLPPNYVLKSLRHGTVDLLQNPLKVTGPLPQEIQLAIGLIGPPTWVRVSGRVNGFDWLPTFGTNHLVMYGGDGDVLPLETPIALDGTFSFARVLPGRYLASVTEAGGSRFNGVAEVPIQVTAGRDITAVELNAFRLIPVTARIEVEGQAPLPYVFFSFAGPKFFPSADDNSSNGTVRYQLPPGEYRVNVLSISNGYTVTSLAQGTVDLLKDPLKVEPDKPLEFTVKVRTSLTGVKVSGRVIRQSSSGPAPARITLSVPLSSVLSSPRGIAPPRSLATAVNPDGSFEFSSVIAGSYIADVSPDPAFRSDQTMVMLHHPQTLVVADSDVSGFEVRIPRQVRMTGRIVVEGDGPMPRPSLTTEFVTDPPGLKGGLSGTIVRVDGTFGLTLPEGDYRFKVEQLLPGYYVKSMTEDGRETLDKPMSLTRDSTELVVVVAAISPARKVSGRVIDAPNPGSTSSLTVRLTAGIMNINATVGPDGSFEFPKVPPGTYQIGLDRAEERGEPRLVLIGGSGDSGSPRITVADQDIENLRISSRFEAPRGRSVRTRVIVEGGGPMPRFGMTVNGGGGSVDPSRVDGTFDAWLPFGFSRISLSEVPQEYVLKTFTYGDVDLLKESPNVTAADRQDLRIVFAPSASKRWKRVTGRLSEIEKFGTERVWIFLGSLHQNVEVAMNSDGSFEFPQVLAGSYGLRVRVGDDLPENSVGIRTLEIAENDIIGLEIPPLRRITTRVSTDGNVPSGLLHLWADRRRDAGGRTFDFYPINGQVNRYFISGDWFALSRIPFGYRVKTLTYGAIDLLKESIRFDSSMNAEISIVLESAPPDPLQPEFTLTGRVRSASNSSSRYRVTATYMEHERRDTYTMVESVVLDDGSFQFNRLPPGAYEIRIPGLSNVARIIVPASGVAGVVLSVP